ncbi:MAG: hypothetical protein RBR16_14195 [Syntrophus sp. (in: bacteria)]|nr:hypothetical protein [Syntrophus sp. (in: bacteria)]
MPQISIQTKMVNGVPVLPEWELLWHEPDKNGVPTKGGYSVVGPVKDTVLVLVEAPQATIDAMKLEAVKYTQVTKEKETELCEAQGITVEKYKELCDCPWASDLIVTATSDGKEVI